MFKEKFPAHPRFQFAQIFHQQEAPFASKLLSQRCGGWNSGASAARWKFLAQTGVTTHIQPWFWKFSPRLWWCSVSSSMPGGVLWIHSAAAEFVQQQHIGINVSVIIDVCVTWICMQNVWDGCNGQTCKFSNRLILYLIIYCTLKLKYLKRLIQASKWNHLTGFWEAAGI